MGKIYAVRKGKVPGIYRTWDECSAMVRGFSGAEYKSFMSEDDANAYMSDATLSDDAPKSEDAVTEKPAAKEPVVHVDDTDYGSMQSMAYRYADYLADNGLVSSDLYSKILQQIDINIMVKKESQKRMQLRNGKPYPSHVDVYVDGSYNSDTNEYGYGIYFNDGERERILCGRGECTEGGRNVEGEVAAAKTAIEMISLNRHYNSVTIYHDYQGIGSWGDGSWKANKSYSNAYSRFVKDARSKGLDINFVHVDGHTGVEGNEYVDKLAKMGCGIALTSSEKQFISKLSHVQGYPSSNELPEPDADPSYTLMGDYMPEM